MNELYDLNRNVALLLPYVDTVTVIDGGSVDSTIVFMRNWTRQSDKVRFFLHPWKDDFPGQRNNVLARIGEAASDGDWVLFVDPDEFLEPDTLSKLRDIATVAEGKPEHYTAVGIQCRSESYRGLDRVWDNLDDYRKVLFYRWHSGLHYSHPGEKPVHEILDGRGNIYWLGQHPEFPSYIYTHRKQENTIWPRGARNLFCGGGGMNMGSTNHRWVELRTICSSLGVNTWHQFNAYLLAGNVDSRLKDWMHRHRQESGYDGAGEHREVYKTYYRLYHPEEEPAEMRGEHVP